MKLTERDLLIFKMIDKFRVLNSELICFYCGFTSYVSVIRRLRMLSNTNYLTRYRQDMNHEYVYALTQKSINLICEPKKSKTNKLIYRKPSKIVVSHIYHEIIIARIVKKILEQNDIVIDDIELDREIRPKEYKYTKKIHIPDIRIKKFNTIIEVELNYKKKTDLFKNISDNHLFYQLWIVPKEKHTLIKRIKDQAQYENNTTINVITIEEIDSFLFDLQSMKKQLLEENVELQSKLELSL